MAGRSRTLVVGLLVLVLSATACDLPTLREARRGADALPETSFLYAADGTPMTRLHAGVDRVSIGGRRIPDVVRDAVPRDPWARDLHPSAGGPHPATVGDVMSFHPVALLPDVELPVAADLLVSSQLTSLPVVEDGVVVGILTRRDLVTVLAPPEEEKP